MDSKATVAAPPPAIANAPLAGPPPVDAQPPSAHAASNMAAIAAREAALSLVDASLIDPCDIVNGR
jgi:hypothetical protein